MEKSSSIPFHSMPWSPVKTRRNHWTGDTSLVGAVVGLNPTRNQIILIAFDLAQDLVGYIQVQFIN